MQNMYVPSGGIYVVFFSLYTSLQSHVKYRGCKNTTCASVPVSIILSQVILLKSGLHTLLSVRGQDCG